MRYPLSVVLKGHADEITLRVEFNKSVLIQVPGLINLGFFEHDAQGVGFLEVLDLHLSRHPAVRRQRRRFPAQGTRS